MDKPHKKLDAWKEAIALITLLYTVAKRFPADEVFGLTSQIKRAAVSVAANIAEGAARNSKREFLQFLYIARGSLSEVDTFVEVAVRLGYIDKEIFTSVEAKMTRIDKMLAGLIQFLRKKS